VHGRTRNTGGGGYAKNKLREMGELHKGGNSKGIG